MIVAGKQHIIYWSGGGQKLTSSGDIIYVYVLESQCLVCWINSGVTVI